jgi:catechol 2,3-dioxygenase-like lactoylglutathione lyase family enzyme
MKIVGPEALTYGVEDMDAAKRFWTDFGLGLAEETPGRLVFETLEKTAIVARPKDAADLPAAVEPGSTLRELTWGVATERDLVDIAAALKGWPSLQVTNDAVRAIDPNGYPIAFRVTRRVPVKRPLPGYNHARDGGRVNRRSTYHKQAHPEMISHVAWLAPKYDAAIDFYRNRLEFRMSDQYPDDSIFLRASAANQHHNLFLIKGSGRVGFHHVAFEMESIHEVIGGGLAMSDKGWETLIGPGRHAVSSAYFWYFKNPCGGFAEYDWDSDYLTDEWEPRDWPKSHATFAEWLLPSGLGRFKGFEPGKGFG